jgi:hypothetical protein
MVTDNRFIAFMDVSALMGYTGQFLKTSSERHPALESLFLLCYFGY